MQHTYLIAPSLNVELPTFPHTLEAARRSVRQHLRPSDASARVSIGQWLDAKAYQQGDLVDDNIQLFGWSFLVHLGETLLTRVMGRTEDPIHLTSTELLEAANAFLKSVPTEQRNALRLGNSARTYDTYFSVELWGGANIFAPKTLHKAIASSAAGFGYKLLR